MPNSSKDFNRFIGFLIQKHEEGKLSWPRFAEVFDAILEAMKANDLTTQDVEDDYSPWKNSLPASDWSTGLKYERCTRRGLDVLGAISPSLAEEFLMDVDRKPRSR